MVLRPIITTLYNLRYPLVDNPFYDNNGNLIGEERLIKTILDAERETSEDLSLKVEVLSAAIFGSVAERYTRRKIRLNPNSDLNLFVRLKDPFENYTEQELERFLNSSGTEEYYGKNIFVMKMYSERIFKETFRQNVLESYEIEKQKDNTGIFLLSLSLVVSYKPLRDWEEDQGLGFFIDNFYPLFLPKIVYR